MISTAVMEYFEALERLTQDKPINVAKGTPINKATVAQEAGRAAGSIRQRKGFDELITEIEKRSKSQTAKRRSKPVLEKLGETRDKIKDLENKLTILEGRYLSLLHLNLSYKKTLEKHGITALHLGAVSDNPISVYDTVFEDD
ncbi:hypothetical protein RJD39_14820 [Vibrio scophthalmi]|uniref:hypothetical protein n=1 Tax=Vibrio scophthalmi TaxID=45658 RepID=UPI0038730A6C